MTLPDFPVDDATLDMLMAAIDPRAHGDTEAKTSGVWPFLDMMSQLGGSDPTAIAEVLDDGEYSSGTSTVVMRDPTYHENDVLTALVGEIRRLRRSTLPESPG